MYIVVEGNIGSGKTSLVHKLCQQMGGTPMLEEFAENTFLPRFYEDPARFAFPLELSFLAARYQQFNQVFTAEKSPFIISDYHFEKCRVFASVNLQEHEMELFDTFFKMMEEKTPTPNLVVFLKNDSERLKTNIRKRGRSYEQGMDAQYLDRISEAYDRRINSMKKHNILNINASKLDFVSNPTDFQFIMDQINEQLAW
ncbi:MAG: deoxynucleoside kinase [Bacteroidia bacterium]